MNYVCKENKCTGCNACIAVCPKNAISIKDTLESYNAVIDDSSCVNCNACRRVCQVNEGLSLELPIHWFQGWSRDKNQRHSSSSGGAAFELEKTFIAQYGHVWTCRMIDGEFRITEVKSIDDLKNFVGSKYVKSSTIDAFNEIRNQVKYDKVLFVGLPCQVAGLKKYLSKNEQKNLYTIDLICHGTPSPKLLEIFLNQYNYSLHSIRNIIFRTKKRTGTTFEIRSDNKYISTPGTCDSYTMGFLEGLFYTSNCYECRYATCKRISDITLGDSWGSNLPVEEQQLGISLLLVQTEKGLQLIKNSNLSLFPVDEVKAVNSNHQLIEPMHYHKNRHKFFSLLNNHTFNYAIFKSLPYFWTKQKIKTVLIRLKILRGGVKKSIR